MLKRSFGFKDRAGKATKPVKRSFRDDAKLKLMEQLAQPSSPPSAVYVSRFLCPILYYARPSLNLFSISLHRLTSAQSSLSQAQQCHSHYSGRQGPTLVRRPRECPRSLAFFPIGSQGRSLYFVFLLISPHLPPRRRSRDLLRRPRVHVQG